MMPMKHSHAATDRPPRPKGLGQAALACLLLLLCMATARAGDNPVAAPLQPPPAAPASAPAAGADRPGSERAPAAGRTQTLLREGMRIEFSMRSPGNGPEAALRRGEVAQLRLKITDESSGRPVRGLRPAAWLDARVQDSARQGKASSCQERVAVYLKGNVGMRPLIDFNSYHLLVMNQDASISVIDPVVSMTGRTSLLTSIALKGPGADWVKSRDGSRLYVAVPRTSEITVIDTATFRVAGSIALPAPPTRLALQPDGRYLWVGLPEAVVAVDTETHDIARQVPVGRDHHEFAFAGQDRLMLVTSREDRSLSMIDTVTGTQIARHALAGQPVSAAYSPLSRRFYVSSSERTVHVLDGASGTRLSGLEVPDGTGPLQVSPDGRWLVALATTQKRALIFDTAGGSLAWSVPLSGRPYQMVFTDAFAHVRNLDSARVDMINLAELGKSAEPVVSHYEAGSSAPGGVRDLPVAPGLARAASDSAVFVASPADAAIYFYMDGMNAPAGSFQSYGHSPRAVEVVSRAIRETAPGEYTSNARLPVAGQFSVAMLLDAPRMVHCFDLEIESGDQAEATATPVRFDFSGTARTASARSSHRIQFRLLSQKGPVSGAQPLLRYFRAPGTDRGTAGVSETAPGEYEAQITLGEAGAWMIHVQFAATPDAPPQQSYIGIIAR